MLSQIKYTTALLSILAFITTGCSHRAAFPELAENEGELVADEQNVVYDDSVSPVQTPKVKVATNAAPQKVITEIPDKTIETSADTKDLTKPNPEVRDSDALDNVYIMPRKTTPVVITDMDLTEMDAADSEDIFESPAEQAKIIKPVTETTVILPRTTKRKINTVTNNVTNTEPSVFYLAETIYFANGGSTVDSSYSSKLRNIVKEAKAHNGKIIVQGFASSRTKDTDILTHKMTNLKVSEARANSVAKLLKQYGMPASQVITEGLSDSRPAYLEVMPEGERLNRRAEVYISY